MCDLNYGEALEAVKKGKLATRKGWNGKGMFVFMRPTDELSIDFIINNVKSLPQSVKNYFKDQVVLGLNGDNKIKFKPYLCLKASDNSIVNGWVASQDDMLSNDWQVLDIY